MILLLGQIVLEMKKLNYYKKFFYKFLVLKKYYQRNILCRYKFKLCLNPLKEILSTLKILFILIVQKEILTKKENFMISILISNPLRSDKTIFFLISLDNYIPKIQITLI